MSPYVISYLVIFIPLVSSLVCFLISLPNSSFVISFVAKILIGILLAKMAIDLSIYEKIAANLEIGIISIPTEYNIDQLSMFFLLLIIFIKITADLYYNSETRNALIDINSQQLFYAVELLNLFAIIGILTTENTLNLYIYIEIYSLTFYAMICWSENLSLARLSFKYFCHGVIGSVFLLISFLYLYLLTNQVNFDLLNSYLVYLPKLDFTVSVIIVGLLFIGLLLKFFPFWLYFEKLKINNSIINFLSIFSLFIQVNLGIYLIIRLLFFLLGLNFSFGELRIDLLLALIGSSLVFYSNLQFLNNSNLKIIASYLLLNNFGLIIIGIAVSSRDSLMASFLYLINYSLVGLLIFFFVSYFSKKSFESDIILLSLLKNKSPFLNFIFKIIILSVISFPLTISFIANWKLIYAVANFDYFLLIIPLITNGLAIIKLSMNIIDASCSKVGVNKLPLVELIEFDDKNLAQIFSFVIILTIIFSLFLMTKFLIIFIDNLSSHLL